MRYIYLLPLRAKFTCLLPVCLFLSFLLPTGVRAEETDTLRLKSYEHPMHHLFQMRKAGIHGEAR